MKKQKFIEACVIESTKLIFYPLFGPFGTNIGRTIPTTAHITVKTVIAGHDAPIFVVYNRLNKQIRPLKLFFEL